MAKRKRTTTGTKINKRSKKQVTKIVKKVIQGTAEKKYHISADTTSALQVANYYQVELFPIDTGTGGSDRIGLDIKPTSLRGKYRILWDSSANTKFVTVAVYIDKEQATGIAPLMSGMYPVTLTNTNYPIVKINSQLQSRKGRYQVLFSKVHRRPVNQSGQVISVHSLNLNFKPSQKIHFSGNSWFTNIDKGQIYLAMNSDSTTTGTTCTYRVISRFTDT